MLQCQHAGAAVGTWAMSSPRPVAAKEVLHQLQRSGAGRWSRGRRGRDGTSLGRSEPAEAGRPLHPCAIAQIHNTVAESTLLEQLEIDAAASGSHRCQPPTTTGPRYWRYSSTRPARIACAARAGPETERSWSLVRRAAAGILAVRPGECLCCYVGRLLDEYGCGCTLRFGRQHRDAVAPRATALERRLGYVGGYCDYEIVLNGWSLDQRFWTPDGEVVEDGIVRQEKADKPASFRPVRRCIGARSGRAATGCGVTAGRSSSVLSASQRAGKLWWPLGTRRVSQAVARRSRSCAPSS